MNRHSVFRNTLVVLATIAFPYLAYRLCELLVVFFISLVFASTIRPAVEKLVGWRGPGASLPCW